MTLYLPIADVTLSLWLLLGIGTAVGFVSGLFGIGGGFLMTPLLILLGIPPAVAVGTGALPILASSLSGTMAQYRRGNVDTTLGAVLIAGGLAGAAIGVETVAGLRHLGQFDVTVSLAYVILLSLIAALMLVENLALLRRRGAHPEPSGPRRKSEHVWLHRLPLKMRFRASKLYVSALPVAVIGAFVGFLMAAIGFGGGLIVVPALIYLLRVPASFAIGTSLFQATFVSAATAILHAYSNHTLDAPLGVVLVCGVVLGAQLGASAGPQLKGWHLRVSLAVLVMMVALRVGYDLFIEPSEPYTVQTLIRGLQ